MFWRQISRIGAVALVGAAGLCAQSEAQLRQAFEGKFIRVKIDMPGTKDGVDFHWRRQPPIDFQGYSRRIKNHAVALRAGDRVMITTIKVKPKNIEFHLGGGGFGTFGDSKPSNYIPSVSKSRAESDLEKELKNESDPKRKDRLRSDLARLQRDRYRAEQERQARMKELEAINRQEVERKEREGGSRINLWFPEGYLKESVPTPEELLSMLAEYVEYDPSEGPRRTTSMPLSQAPPPAAANPSAELKRGMSIEQVHQAYGRPSKSVRSNQGALETLTETFELPDRRVEVLFVDGLVIKFSVSSK